MKKFLFSFQLILCFCCTNLFAQNFYALDTIQQIEIKFAEPNWDYILDTAKMGSDSYTMAVYVRINGVQFDSAGVKYKGNSSYNAANAKNPLHIELDHFKSQDYLGIKDIKLSNGYHEPSSVREVLLYRMAAQYMPVSNANYAQVYINDSLWGLYTNVEAITKTFLADRYFTDNNTFVFADNGGCNLTYKGTDTTLYYSPYTMKSSYGWTNLRNLTDSLKNNINAIETILDVDRTLWMLAFTNVTVTLDSYLGQSTHNYYIYQDHNGRFNPILWDLNGGLGIFNKASMGPSLTIPQMQNMSPMLHSTDSLWPLVKNILAVPMFKRMYIAHMRTIVNENFVDSSYYFDAQYLESIIDTAVSSDPNAFYTHTEFLDNLTIDVVDGPKTIPGLTNLMETRTPFLNSTPEFLLVPPAISSVVASDTMPLLNSTIYITVTVTNATQVYLGKRNSVMEKFTRILMFDDGLHGDGGAGDNVFGIDVLMDATTLHYYVYADNANAGIFSPERAEYEYFTIETQKGVVINELMSDNQTTQVDDYLEYNDWIELYNNSSSAIDLTGYSLSDDATNLSKWNFPSGTIMNAGAYLIVWTDADTTQTIGLHANFKLSAAGESIYFSNSSAQIVDAITFPAMATDITYGRYPNGVGAFNELNPTYNAVNSYPILVEEITIPSIDFDIYPNPSSNFITIEVDGFEQHPLIIYTSLGKMIINESFSQKKQLDITNLTDGLYFVRIENKTRKFIKTSK